MDVCERAEGNLLSCRSADQQVSDLLLTLTKSQLHPDDKIKEFLALDDLRCRLTTDRGLDDGFNVGHVDAVTGNPVAINVNISWAGRVRGPP